MKVQYTRMRKSRKKKNVVLEAAEDLGNAEEIQVPVKVKSKVSKKGKKQTSDVKDNSAQKVATKVKEEVQVIDHTKKVEFKKEELPDDDGFGDSRKRKKTEDGLPVFYDSELKIGLGKDTPDCPFDCDCCF